MFPEHQRSIVGLKKRKKVREKRNEKPKKTNKKTKIKQEVFEDEEVVDPELDCWDDPNMLVKEEMDDEDDSKPQSPTLLGGSSKRSRKKAAISKTPEIMAARRRKVWQTMAKKELGKVQRAKANNHKEILTNCKRVAGFCMKVFLIIIIKSSINFYQ